MKPPFVRERGPQIWIRRDREPLTWWRLVLGLALLAFAIMELWRLVAMIEHPPVLVEIRPADVHFMKIRLAVQFGVALVIAVMAFVGRRREAVLVDPGHGDVVFPEPEVGVLKLRSITAVVLGVEPIGVGLAAAALRYTLAFRKGEAGAPETSAHVVTSSVVSDDMVRVAVWLCDRLELPLSDEVYSENERDVPVARLRAAEPIVRIVPLGIAVGAHTNRAMPCWAVETVRGPRVQRVVVVDDEAEARKALAAGRRTQVPAPRADGTATGRSTPAVLPVVDG